MIRTVKRHVRVNHGALPLSPRQSLAVLHSEDASVADFVQDIEELAKVNFARTWFLTAGCVGKLHRAEHVPRLYEEFRHVFARHRLIEDVEEQSTSRTADSTAELGRLIERPQIHSRRIAAGYCRLEQHANAMSLARVSTEFQRVDSATKLNGLGNVRRFLAGDDDQIGATHTACRVDGQAGLSQQLASRLERAACKSRASEMGHPDKGGERQSPPRKLCSNAALQLGRFASQTAVDDRAKTFVVKELDLIDRVAAGVMDKQSQLGRVAPRKTPRAAAQPLQASESDSAGESDTAREPESQKFASIQHGGQSPVLRIVRRHPHCKGRTGRLVLRPGFNEFPLIGPRGSGSTVGDRAMGKGTKFEQNAGLARLCRSDILSIDEERRLFTRLRSVRAKELRSNPKSSTTARSRCAHEAAAIRNRIVECNLRLVVSLARHYTAPERPVEDLVSEATLPLIRCVESFDSRRGTRFSTYATRALTNWFARVRRLDSRRRSRFSQGENWREVPAAEGRTTASDRLTRAEALARLGDGLARLSPRERVLVAERFGLTGDRCPRTFRELGARHGLSKERVRVITCRAISRLRQSFDEFTP